MNISQVFSIAIDVLKNPYLIGTAVFIILYCNFVNYIVHYKKKPATSKRKKSISASPTPQTNPEEQNAENSEEQQTEG